MKFVFRGVMMVTVKELDDAKKITDDAFNEYCLNENTTTAKDFYLKQKRYISLFNKYWSGFKY